MSQLKEFKLIVAGGRDFTDYEHMSRVLIAMADTEFADYAVSIVSGMAKGADALGVRFAKEHNVKLYEFPAEWKKYAKRAGFIRNEDMAKFADGLLAFWDGESRGTKHMIQTMYDMNKQTHIVRYPRSTQLNSSELKELCSGFPTLPKATADVGDGDNGPPW